MLMILGIDLGQKTTGIAISEGTLASPYSTITHKSLDEAVSKIGDLCTRLSADTVVIGFVEGKIKSYFEKFAQKFQRLNPKLKVILWDETLTTRQAVDTMIKLDVPKKKRAQKMHEVAAGLILQSYIDNRLD